jgi:hypothetical protein
LATARCWAVSPIVAELLEGPLISTEALAGPPACRGNPAAAAANSGAAAGTRAALTGRMATEPGNFGTAALSLVVRAQFAAAPGRISCVGSARYCRSAMPGPGAIAGLTGMSRRKSGRLRSDAITNRPCRLLAPVGRGAKIGLGAGIAKPPRNRWSGRRAALGDDSGMATAGRSAVKTVGRSAVETVGRSAVETVGRSAVETAATPR